MNVTAFVALVAAIACLFDSGPAASVAQELPIASRHNPVGDPPIHLRDPFILSHQKKYFLFGTPSTSEGFQCYESFDLLNWKLDGWAWRMSGLRVARGGLRSPQVFVYQGMYCLVYGAQMPSGNQLALAASTKPEGPYHDLHVPWLNLAPPCTDGQVFVDDNGKAYLTYTGRRASRRPTEKCIFGVALNKDLSKTLGEPAHLLEASQRWEGAGRDESVGIEAANLFKIGSKYYLTYSANAPNTPERSIGYATADKPLGPWTKSPQNPLLSTRLDAGIVGPGHATVMRSVDRKEWFILYQSLVQATNSGDDVMLNIDALSLEGIRTLAVKSPPRRLAPSPAGSK